MGIATLAALTDTNEPIKVAVSDEGYLIVETAPAPLALQAHDKLDAIVELLADIKEALEAQ